MTNKTRFAPSPTGYLHVGGARTALYSWLHARKHNDKFVLRIEDTDRERSTDESVQAIMDGMNWLGLDYDEGPYFQTKRFDRYEEIKQQLVKEGKAYPCFCSKERLEALREQQQENKKNIGYDGHCRNLTADEQNLSKDHVIRFKNPLEGAVVFDDLIKGSISVNNSELDDLIIARTDGTPTYNFTVVVDDLDMGISHVIRGDDHVNNTPRQINMMNALNAGDKLPLFAHVPMILGDDGKRLSKRHGAVGVMQYRDDGYLPQAVLNYLVRLGWSHGDQELFSREEMIELFDLTNVNRAPSAFNTEKLNWINQQYMKSLPVEEVAEHLQWHLEQQNIDTSNGPDIKRIIPEMAERVKTLKELAGAVSYFYADYQEFDAKAAKKHLRPVARQPLELAKQNLSDESDWSAENLHGLISKTAEELEVGMGKVGMPLRVAITGAGMSPDLGVTLEWIGKEAVLRRIDKALEFIAEREANS